MRGIMGYSYTDSDGILERITPPTLRSLYLFWLMQVTQGEIDPSLVNDIILSGAGILHRTTLNAMELETLLKVHVTIGRLRRIIEFRQAHPVHGAVLRSLDHAERLLVRRSHHVHARHQDHRVGGIVLVGAKSRSDGGVRGPR
jgi:hypothetical protein